MDSEIDLLRDISRKRELNKTDVDRVWAFSQSNDANERFNAYLVLEDYVDDGHQEILIARASTEGHWLPRSALYVLLLDIGTPSAISFLERKFENETNPNAKYVLGIRMREARNTKVLNLCASNRSKQTRWILARYEAQFFLGQITVNMYRWRLRKLLQKRSNWRFIEHYLETAGMSLPSDKSLV